MLILHHIVFFLLPSYNYYLYVPDFSTVDFLVVYQHQVNKSGILIHLLFILFTG